MRLTVAPLLLGATVGLASAACAADQPTVQPGAATAPGMMGRGMMGGGMMNMDAMACMSASDERLAAAKAELDLTSAQLPLWNAFVETAEANAQRSTMDAWAAASAVADKVLVF